MELSTEGFMAVLWTLFGLFFPELNDSSLKPSNVPQSQLNEKYDFIIVGAGPGGCIAAHRLSENPDWSVLLIEAGSEEDPLTAPPLISWSLTGTHRDWNFTTQPQKYACLSRNGICTYPQGHVMGGSSVIGQLFYIRGNRRDYDEWEELGNKGWGYDNILKYFIKAETLAIPFLDKSPYHGTQGPYQVQYPIYRSPLWSEYTKAGEELGLKKQDYNGREQNGIDNVQYGLLGPLKGSVARAYLHPIRHRKNLHVIKESLVVKININEQLKQAKGVTYIRNGEKYTVKAEKEVIVSAGTINTPKLLMLSGIGPQQQLESHNIKTIVDLPVGKNLHDHPVVPLRFVINKKATITSDIWKTNDSLIDFTKNKYGPMTTFGGEATAFLNTYEKNGVPNFQMMFYSFFANFSVPIHQQLITTFNAVLTIKSRGVLTLRSSNPYDPPLIDPGYFTAPEDVDVMFRGLHTVFEFMTTPTMAKYSPMLSLDVQPLCKDLYYYDYLWCAIWNYSQASYHIVGSAKMGPDGDKEAVVNPELKVQGVERLRVVDASVMPVIPRANTLAPSIAVGEKGADLIKSTYLKF